MVYIRREFDYRNDLDRQKRALEELESERRRDYGDYWVCPRCGHTQDSEYGKQKCLWCGYEEE